MKNDPNISQREASNPDNSVWVSAHAGSGKTTVLSSRVIRLLLRGASPGSILCLTYTKAAATQMANKIYQILSTWVKYDDITLAKAIEAIDKPVTSREALQAARHLFTLSLETPGGLKVQTIHAFCASILRKFPLEAGVPANFSEIDESTKADILDKELQTMLQDVSFTPIFAELSQKASDTKLLTLFKDILDKKRDIQAFLTEHNHDFTTIYTFLCKSLGSKFSTDEIEEQEKNTAFSNHQIKEIIAQLLPLGLTREVKNIITPFQKYLAGGSFKEYQIVFLKLNKDQRKDFLTAKPKKLFPDVEALFHSEAERLYELHKQKKAALTRDFTIIILKLADRLISGIEARKLQRSLLDFDDLIEKTAALLNQGATSWVNYKLDQGIDHILVDEAQDTSPLQWEIIQSLADEFTSGNSARQTKRTLFVVGDEKQSIYSFQGADPRKFDTMQKHFANEFLLSQQEFHKVPLKTSFRSSASILTFVDHLNTSGKMQGGIMTSGSYEPHIAHKEIAGIVELWPLFEEDEKGELDYLSPIDRAKSSVTELAEAIATSIDDKLKRGFRLSSHNRPVQARDFLILMKKRGALFMAVNSALKKRHIATAGSDRLVITEHLAARDLMNFGWCLFTPHDDLSLASLLVSPLFGFDQQDLYDLAHKRAGALFEALDETTKESFTHYQTLALTLTPLEFYQRVLLKDQGRAKFIARFGHEVEDVLDGFMAKVESFEATHLPSLLLFIHHLKQSSEDLKRDADVLRDEVRVMTVHGAKGLEAPIVYLCDVTKGAKGGRPKLSYKIEMEGQSPFPLWSAGSEDHPDLIEKTKKEEARREDEEYQRLLYVGLTRAEEQLILCGIKPKKKEAKDRDTWHDLIAPIMEHYQSEIGRDGIQRFSLKPYEQHYELGTIETTEPADFTLSFQPFEELDMREKSRRLERTEAEDIGITIHKLMQVLPDLSKNEREILIEKHFGDDQALKNLFQQEEFLILLEKKAFNEIIIAGLWQGVRIERRIDRLVIEEDRLIILDYKTGEQSELTKAIREQMLCYATLLSPAFPHKKIEAKVIFIQSAKIIDVPLDLNLVNA